VTASPPEVEDRAGAVRRGEELDLAAVHAWIAGRVPGLEGTPQVTQYTGGASNWTYRLRYPAHDFILRRPPAGTKAKSSHDMSREYTVQSHLRPLFPYVPAMVGLCEDESVLGAPFYVMHRIAGIIPRREFPPGLRLDAGQARALCLGMLDRLIELHAVDYCAAGLQSLWRGSGYVRRQVEGWSDRYERARTPNVPRYRRVRAWLRANAPDDVASCVIHNDWRFDNLVLSPADPARIVGVLDWEMATIGDPLMDLGSALAYWVEADDNVVMRSTRRQPTHLPGMLRRQEVVAYYLERTGRAPENWAFYEVFGLFRLAAIAQQIYYRYWHRQTRNPAFRNYWILIHYFDWRGRGIIRRNAKSRRR
jgi:aminoglycoside phosphotransferase (APT) family kinase protein